MLMVVGRTNADPGIVRLDYTGIQTPFKSTADGSTWHCINPWDTRRVARRLLRV
jgi:hypothetical protein